MSDHRNFIKNTFFWRQVTAIFGKGLLTSEGEFWLAQRRLAAPAFAGKRLTGYGDVMVRHTHRMLDRWEDQGVRDLHADMMSLTLGIAAKTLFDADVEEDVAEIHDAVNMLSDEIASRFGRPIVIPDWLPLPGHVRYRRALSRIEAVVNRIIHDRRASGGDHGDLLSKLMSAWDETGSPMSDRQLRDEVITLLLAGHETTALALSWTGYLLGQHPEIQEKVADEIRGVLAGRSATPDDLSRLAVTTSVITEAMRLYPPAWAIGREALHDCEIGRYRVAAGTTIYISAWVVHRDPRHFANPSEFQPERWWSDGVRDLPRFAYFPFGGGPRICIGNRFAIMEAVLILATVMQRFRLALMSHEPVVPFPTITLRPQGGVHVTLQARSAR